MFRMKKILLFWHQLKNNLGPIIGLELIRLITLAKYTYQNKKYICFVQQRQKTSIKMVLDSIRQKLWSL